MAIGIRLVIRGGWVKEVSSINEKFPNFHSTSIYVNQLTRLSSHAPPMIDLIASGANDVSVMVASAWPAEGGLLSARKESRDKASKKINKMIKLQL